MTLLLPSNVRISSLIRSSSPLSSDMATPPPPPPPAPGFLTVVSEAWRIITAHSRHFLALSVLFLLPMSFSVAVYPNLFPPSSSADPNLRLRSSDYTKSLAGPLAYTAFLYLFSILATCSITYSTVQGFYGRPVKLLPALRSIYTSAFRLIATTLCRQLIIALVAAGFGLFVLLVVTLAHLIHHPVDYSSPIFIMSASMIGIVFVSTIQLYLQVQWSLVNVLVVAESVWGFYPLKRSTQLVKGMRKPALSLMLSFSLSVTVLMFGSSALPVSSSSGGWKSWVFVLFIVVVSSSITLLNLLYLASYVVLYKYCKAVHGELAVEIADEFARDYVSLPFDDGKVPHVVSVAYV